MQCVGLRKTSSFYGWLFYKFLFVLVQTSYCHCTCVNNLMQTAAQFSKKKTEKYRAFIGKFFKVNVKNCHHCEKTQTWFNFHSVFWMVTEFAECARKHVNFHVMHLQRSWCVQWTLFIHFWKAKNIMNTKNVLRSCHINQTMTNQIQTFRIFVVDVKSCDLSNFLCFFLYSDIPIVCRWKLVVGLVHVKYPR